MKNILFLFITCLPLSLLSQNPEALRANYWYFGFGAGLDFSDGTPVPITNGGLHTYESSSSISDLNGNLLFYTDADTVWNRNHSPMPNGHGLLGCGDYFGSSSQAGLIVPQPANDSIYYIFTTDCWENSAISGFRYSIVNMNLNNGLGDVVEKNNLLFAPNTEGVAAVKHRNNIDYWIVTHEYNTNRFFSYKLDSTGLNIVPVITSIGSIYWDFVVYLRFSLDGKKLASAASVINELYDFDNATGIVSNRIPVNGYTGEYSPTFSPDGSKLYFMNSGNLILQYCLLEDDSAAINSSMTLVAHSENNSAYGGLQNGIDNKIYIASGFDFNSFVSVIHNPNVYGAACNFSSHSLYLDGKTSYLGLPNFVANYLYSGDSIPILDCSGIGIEEDGKINPIIYPNPSHNKLNIKVSNAGEIYISIYNLLGAILFDYKFYSSDISIDLTNLPEGMYVLNIINDNKRFTQKLIIRK